MKRSIIKIPNMRDIDNHANPVHLVDESATIWAYPMPFWLRLSCWPVQNRSICVFIVAIVSQCSVTNPEVVKQPQIGQLVANLMETLNA